MFLFTCFVIFFVNELLNMQLITYVISYHIYIENQHGQLPYHDVTEDTSYELYNLTVCDIYTATVIAHSGGYSSSNVNVQKLFAEGIIS